MATSSSSDDGISKLERGQSAMDRLNASPMAGEWVFDTNMLISRSDEKEAKRRCINLSCTKREGETDDVKLLACARCGVLYCSRECQVSHWKRSHKDECALFKAFRSRDAPADGKLARRVVEQQLRRARLYICPYAAVHHRAKGNGMIYIRSPNTLSECVSVEPVDCFGRDTARNIIVQYLTLGEFDGIAFEDDFEMGVIREPLKRALDEYDAKTHIIAVVLLSDGFYGCVKFPVVQDYNFCLRLGDMYEYEKKETIQLNLDS